VRDVLDAHPHIRYYVDVHSFGALILFSWGDDEPQSTNSNQNFLYPMSATSDDYAFHRHRVDSALGKVYGFTIELGQQFVPPYAEMQRIMADVGAAITELCRCVAEA
jgi:hypothetical protein